MELSDIFHWPGRREKLRADRRLLGAWGEKQSERYLRRKGYKTLARNFSCKTGEIDLVMAGLDASVVFVEVKTRAKEEVAEAEASVTAGKQTKLLKAAKYFLATHKIEDRPCRFDVVAVVLDKSGPVQIRHYENTFVP